MPVTTVTEAYRVLDAYPGDWVTLVRDRRQRARAELDEATRMAEALKAGDADAIAYLQSVAADAGTGASLKSAVNQKLALHARRKQELAAEV